MHARLLITVAVTLGLLFMSVRGAAAAVPPGFFGVAPQDGLTTKDYERMDGVVGTIRVPVYWPDVEPRPGERQFAALDDVVGRAADAGIDVLPFVYGSPSWVTTEPARAPRASGDRRAWAAFLSAVVRRYGPEGEFWQNRPWRRPIRRWQLWNEPNFPLFWAPRPSPRDYVRLLSSGARSIRAVDPDARIVLAGLAPIEGEPFPWEYLRRVYTFPAARRSFDAVALHPYSPSMRSLAYQLRETRRVMAAAGDGRTPIEITEIGVASSGQFPSTMVQGPNGQASFLRSAFRLLLKNRRRWRLEAVIWFTWRDWPTPDRTCVFCQGAGLFDVDDRPKPAWTAYRQMVTASTAHAVR